MTRLYHINIVEESNVKALIVNAFSCGHSTRLDYIINYREEEESEKFD